MHGYWSLVIFTLLGQAAAGMLILSFFSRTADTSRAKAWAACILLGVGALASLEHLSDPTVSFYTITNVGTSWLTAKSCSSAVWSRASPLADHAQCMGTPSGRHPRPCFCLCHEPGLHHPDRSFLEFAVHLLALSRHQPAARFQPAALHGRPCHRKDPEKKAALLLGWYPVFIVLAFILQMLVIPLQLLLGAIAVLHLSAGMAFDAPALRRSAGPSAAHP